MIYFVQGNVGTPIKIGYTQSESGLAARVRALQTSYPWELRVLARCDGTIQDERRIHDAFSGYRLMGEWFDPAPRMGQFIADCEREGVARAIEIHGSAVQADASSQWDDMFISEARADNLFCLRPGAVRLARLEKRAPTFRTLKIPNGRGEQRFYRVGDLRRWLREHGHLPRIDTKYVRLCRDDPSVQRRRDGSCWNNPYGINTYGTEPRL